MASPWRTHLLLVQVGKSGTGEPIFVESVTRMARICCLAAIDPDHIPALSAALKDAGGSSLSIVARLDVAELSRLAPDLLVADVDRLEVEPLEVLRQLRFVLPQCVLIAYTATTTQSWARECHLAGAAGVLSKDSDTAQLANGLRHAVRSGCWTDPRFARTA
jgi:DNA-binding NarL/FixJ family response regulator